MVLYWSFVMRCFLALARLLPGDRVCKDVVAKARAEDVALSGLSSRTGCEVFLFEVRRSFLCLLMQELDEALIVVPALDDADAKDLLIEFGEGLSRLALGGGMRNT